MSVRRWYADLPIRLKLLAPFVILMLVWGGFGSYVVARGSASEARGRATARLAESLDSARAAFTGAERAMLENVRLMANTEGIGAALGARDVQILGEILSPIAVNSHLRVEAVDRRGRVLIRIEPFSAGPKLTTGGSLRVPAVLRAARGRGDDRGHYWSAVRGGLFLVAGPVRTATGDPAGAIVVSESFMSQAANMARGTQGVVTIYSGRGRVLGTNVQGASLPFRSAAGGVRASVRAGDDPYEALYAPLVARGRRIGVIAVALPTSVALGAVQRNAFVLAGMVGIAVIAAVAVGWWTAKAITRPLGSLLDATRSLERGELGARAGTRARDEIGTLANSFNRMAEQLQASHAGLERKVHERTGELERVNAELARASAAKSAFLATMSHELRTPLNAIIGFADMLGDPTFGRHDQRTVRELSGNILVSGRHLMTLINDVLDLAKVEAGRIEVRPEPTDAAAVLDEVLAVVGSLAERKGIELTVGVASGLPTVMADPGRLRQVLFNLVANAIKFTPERGRVAIAADASGAEVTVTVTDTGPGLAPGEEARIFEPFERGRAARGEEGAGLGLALARHLVELQGGRIWAQGKPGKGSTFGFTVPVASARAARARTA